MPTHMPPQGLVSRSQFREAARSLGLPLSDSELHVLLQRFCSGANPQRVSYADWLAFLSSRHRQAAFRAAQGEQGAGGASVALGGRSLELERTGGGAGASSAWESLLQVG